VGLSLQGGSLCALLLPFHAHGVGGDIAVLSVLSRRLPEVGPELRMYPMTPTMSTSSTARAGTKAFFIPLLLVSCGQAVLVPHALRRRRGHAPTMAVARAATSSAGVSDAHMSRTMPCASGSAATA